MKTYKGYNFIDLMLISVGVLAVITVSIAFKSPWYVVLTTLLSLFCVFSQAKGKVVTQFLGVVAFSFYMFVAYSKQLYGEAILYLIIMIPMSVYGIIHWLAHCDKDENVVIVKSNLSKKEWIISGVCIVIVAIGVYFLLKALNTAQLLISTLAFISMLPAVYLQARRCKWNQVAFLANDIIVPILWLVLIIQGDLSLISMCVYCVFQMVYDIYGIVEWAKLEKRQKETL